jgi:hypothetical protein
MPGTELFKIPRTVVVEHHPEQKALVAIWESLSTPRFREAVERGMAECLKLGAKTWIVDLTHNPGIPFQEELDWIESEGASSLARKAGVVALVNVHGSSTIATIGARRWNASADKNGLTTYDCRSLHDALEIAADVAAGRPH